MNLTTYLRAGYPGLVILTPEEARAEAEVSAACSELQRHLHAWSSTEGLASLAEERVTACSDPLEALDHVGRLFSSEEPRHVVLMRDLQLHLDQNDPLLVRRLKDLLRAAKSKGHAIILLGCRMKLPPELEHELAIMDFELPGPARLREVLGGILGSANVAPLPDAMVEAVVRNASGMTTVEAENAFALSLAGCGAIDPAVIAREKARTLKRNGLVEVIEDCSRPEEIGGLGKLKDWLLQRAGAFGESAKAYGLPSPKGLLIVGLPGTGKSLTAKVSASAFGVPLLRLDMGRVFGGIVGQSEANLRTVIRTAEAIAPCVLWIDEIEKGFSGSKGSGSSDGGTSSRVFGSFLSWMQEKDKPVFVVATANDVSHLPPEFLRKGRFDEMFFVDLPDQSERMAIWEIVIRKYGRDPSAFDVASLASASADFTGAEIESAFVDGLHDAFAEAADPTMVHLRQAITRTVPLAKLMDGTIDALRRWAKGRAREAASPLAKAPRPSRRIHGPN